MSAPEEQFEGQRSSVEITLNAKREAQVKVKVYVGDTDIDLEAARLRAVAVFKRTVAEVAGGATA